MDLAVCGSLCVIPEAEQVADERQRQAKSQDLQKWKTYSLQVRHSKNLPATSQPWTSRKGVRLMGVPTTPRTLDVIDTCVAVHLGKHPDIPLQTLCKNMYINLSQSVHRLPVAAACPTPSTSACVYSCLKDQIISGRSTMLALGWPDCLLPRDSFSDRNYRMLSGNGFSAIISGLIVAVMFANPHASWNREQWEQSYG